jgi:hypothetical protein
VVEVVEILTLLVVEQVVLENINLLLLLTQLVL